MIDEIRAWWHHANKMAWVGAGAFVLLVWPLATYLLWV